MPESEQYFQDLATLATQPGRLGEILPRFSDILGREGGNLKRNVSHTLRNNFVQVENYLDGLGLRKLAFFGHGANSIVLHSTRGQMVRIAAATERPRIDSDFILQPIISTTLDSGYRVEIMPKADTEHVTDEHVKILQIAMANHVPPLHFLNAVKYNVGLLEDGTPVVLDAGAVIVAGSEPLKKSHAPLIDKDTIPPVLAESDKRGWDGTWRHKQQKHLNALGLEKGKIVNALSGDDLQALETQAGDNRELIEAVKSGAYIDELLPPQRMRLNAMPFAREGSAVSRFG